VYNFLIQEEAKWIIETHQLPSGAIVTSYPERQRIVPYFAHLALYGVIEAGGQEDRVRAYLNWYLAHLERPDRFGIYGTVYDYTVATNGEEIPEGSYDSSDSYAATFLTLVWRYYLATRETSWLKKHKDELETVAGAILATRDKDGLTLARPDWQVKYLMDNCEVYEGLQNYAFLQEEVWGDKHKAYFYQKLARKVKEAILRKMWVGEGFCPAIYRFGLRLRPNWKKWYPDALAQLFPLICGLLKPKDKEARLIYTAFLRNYPDWHRSVSALSFTTPLVAWAAALMGDSERVRTYFKEVEEKILKAGRPWPWHAAEGGIFILALRAQALNLPI